MNKLSLYYPDFSSVFLLFFLARHCWSSLVSDPEQRLRGA